jgi:subtilase family serine protease
MSRTLSVFFFAMLVCATVCVAQPQAPLTRHVRAATTNGQASLIGRLPATRPLRIDLVLPVRDQAGLDNFLREVYDPASTSYRRFLTVAQFTERFGPSQDDYNAVIRFAKASGLAVTGGSRDALDVQLQGSVAAIEAAFHVSLSLYHDPVSNRDFYAPDREPAVDLPFQLWHISGLDNYSIPHPALRKNPGPKSQATTGSCPQQSFCGSDMRAAYYEGKTLTGKGQNIGLLEYAGFDIADVNTYYQNAGQNRTAAVKGISTDGTSIKCLIDQGCDDTEQTIDITQALGMAPGVKTVYVYVGSSDTALLGAMSSDSPLPLQLSSSWGWTPPDPKTDDPYFKKMASQGQSIFQASADSGAYTGSAPWPCNSAYVTSVGGTDLTTTGAGGKWASETAWSDGGGGWGSDVKIPSWQKLWGVITKANQGSTIYRNVPDVAANADFSFYVCADQSGCTANEYGGTSFAAPMWAGYLALVNQQAAANGDPAPGFINPTIYPVGLGSGYGADFHDIISGSNGIPATKGYDLSTGWGSPNGAGLVDALLGTQDWFGISPSPTKIRVVRSKTGTSTIAGSVYGGFDSAVTLSGKGFPSITFSPNPIPAPGSGNSTVTIKVPKSTKLGNYSVIIKGSGDSQEDATTIVVDVVN